MRTLFRCISGFMVLSACSPDRAVEPAARVPVARLSASTSSCYTVSFNVQLVPTASDFSGPVTGDLVGTVSLVFNGDIKFTGNTLSNSGTASWTITGGVVPTPLNFTTTFDNRNLFSDRPGSPATLFENIGTHRALTGVAKANLNYHGTFTIVPSELANHDYRGVICL